MALPVLIASLGLALGALFEFTIYPHRSGVGVGVFFAGAWLACLLLVVRLQRHPSPWVMGPWLAAGFFAVSLARFDSDVVHTMGSLLFWGTLALAVFWSFAPRSPLESLSRPIPGALLALVPRSLACIRPALGNLELPSDEQHLARRIGLGLLCSLPILVLFGALFTASDGAYAQWLDQFLGVAWPTFACSTARIALFSALFLGLLTALCLHEDVPFTPTSPGRAGDPVVVGVVLLMVNLLFATFLLVQARYLFGGPATLLAPGLTCAEYARRGFFELVVVTVCVLGLASFVYRSQHHHPERTGPLALTAFLILQTGGVAASAVQRLSLYTSAYGLTVARFYAAAGLAVICTFLLLVLVAAVRRKSLDWLGSRMTVCLLFVLPALSQVDVEGLVARTHLACRSAHLDVAYLASLSADAVPALVELAQTTRDPALREQLLQALQETRRRMEENDTSWQGRNRSRARALPLLRATVSQAPVSPSRPHDTSPGTPPSSDG